MAFPPAHLLVGIGTAEVVRGVVPLPRWRAWAVAGFLAVLPDTDIVLGIALEHGGGYHGTFTHSIVATLAVALVARILAGQRWGWLAGAGYGSHLLVDLLDDRGRTNVLLGWPVTDTRPLAIGRVFPTVPFEQGGGVWNAVLSLLQPDVFERLLRQTWLASIFMAGLFALAWAVRRVRRNISRPE